MFNLKAHNDNSNNLSDSRIKIIVGHYGSGKTEFSINYSLKRAEMGKKVVLADLDIVNPYFRSREKKDMLEQKGIHVIGSVLNDDANSDIPALSPQLYSIFANSEFENVLDVGGDPIGARVLSRFNKSFLEYSYEMWMVLNANREETQTVEQVISYIDSIQDSSRLNITALVNNTHMMRETTVEDIIRGDELCCKIKQKTGIPTKFTCVPQAFYNKISNQFSGELFYINTYMRPNWL